jgi:CBS domain containing-hemolysin-like protein
MTPPALLLAASPSLLALAEFPKSGGQIILELFTITALVLLNGFFVAAEFAIVKVRLSQLDELIEEGGRRGQRAETARHVVKHLDAYLSACQVGITIASLALGWLGESYVEDLLRAVLVWLELTVPDGVVNTLSHLLAFGIITALHIVLGELMPKSIAIRKSLGTTLWLSPPLRFFALLLKPAIVLLNGTANWLLRVFFKINPASEADHSHSADELALIVAQSHRQDEVTETERDILINALSLSERITRDIMTPRGEVVALPLTASFAENLSTAVRTKHTRFPVVESDLDSTLGIIHVKDLMAAEQDQTRDLRRLALKREAPAVPAIMPLDRLLKVFLSRHAHMALVVDEFGGVIGMVTLDDVIEEVVGEIQDEFDTPDREFQALAEGEFLVDGTLPLHDLAALGGPELESEEVSTIGGYLTHTLGRLPTPGETIQAEGYEITAKRVDARRVSQLHLRKLVKAPEPPVE